MTLAIPSSDKFERFIIDKRFNIKLSIEVDKSIIPMFYFLFFEVVEH